MKKKWVFCCIWFVFNYEVSWALTEESEKSKRSQYIDTVLSTSKLVSVYCRYIDCAPFVPTSSGRFKKDPHRINNFRKYNFSGNLILKILIYENI